MRPRIVCDKHMDPELLTRYFGRLVLNAQGCRPRTRYVGNCPHDEDFTDVLQLAWEEYAPLVTADGALIEKVRVFQAELPKKWRDRCFNGVIVLPARHREQEVALKRFVSGTLSVRCVIHRTRGFNATLEAIDDANLGVDLTAKQPRALELCTCPWDGDD